MKVADFEKLYNFVVDNFFIWNHFIKKNYVWIFQTTSDGETTKMKVIDLKKLYNFVVDNFLICDHLVKINYI
jgi:hypothetical protein